MALTPVPIRCPQVIAELASEAQIVGSSPAKKMITLLNHFFDHEVVMADMSSIDTSGQSKNFTLRMPEKTLTALDAYCAKTLYTRQQAFQIAIVSALADLGLLSN